MDLATALIESPVGPLRLEAGAEGLRRLRFAEPRDVAAPTSTVVGAGGPAADCVSRATRELGEYFAGDRRAFGLLLAPEGTAFQLAVWRALCEIPYGQTTTYGALARRLGKPGAVRAVGAANGRNPIPIVIPCHRVIGSDGRLTGYGGGLEAKRALLRLEGVPLPDEPLQATLF